MDIPIIYEDKHLLIVDKPVNMPTQSDPTGDLDLFSALSHQLGKKQYIGLHHRLDRNVGGCILFTKSKEINKSIAKQIQNHSIRKTYLCIVCGAPSDKSGSLTNFLKKLKSKNKSIVTCESDSSSKLAVLDYEVLETLNNDLYGTLSLLKIKLKTGRHHQIRVQLANADLPILGDRKYNTNLNLDSDICLFSHSISVYHAFKKDFVNVSALPNTKNSSWQIFSDIIKKQMGS